MRDDTSYLHNKLLQGLKKGDEQALEDIMEMYRDKLLLKAYHLLGDLDESRDAVQEVFIKLWGVKSKLQSDTILDKYLITLIRNHCCSLLRKRKVLEIRKEKFSYGLPSYSFVKPMENAELARQLSTAFNTLTDRQRAIFDSVYLEGKSHLEIVKELQIEPQTVKNTISTVLKKLRSNLEFWVK
ncbi:RNA polymerase sigma factor [Chitinophaga ginsengisoli]|uniref:RNA polymerase sigma-70 factor (ECF subfamily) n=1 Tax=Chitinophaga ginsengisoli TaxID=363837 RepID=A0A2P8G9P8_9BACT|nr:sigma-70 family RNA polymerase sigma factor [Chitinophaga ginsengisoli]PSL30693.1 RNA polymerase sigma-70 factor (ECF subfamily) [Chitinophaga ginsengisoli]